VIHAYKNYNNLLHAWMYGDEEFTGHTPQNRMFAEGDAIYSYGNHFMLAKKEVHDNQTYIILNNETYSNTTSKHQSLLSRAIPSNYIRIYVEDPKLAPKVLIQRSIAKIREYLSKIPKATSRKLEYLSSATQKATNILRLVNLYEDQITLKDSLFLADGFKLKDIVSEDWFKKHEEKASKRKAKEEAEDDVRKLKGDEQLAKW